jgi:hypothetical protein
MAHVINVQLEMIHIGSTIAVTFDKYLAQGEESRFIPDMSALS